MIKIFYQIKDGSVSISGNVLLEDIQFKIKNQEKVGLVGRNGCGKTTLLKAIMGEYPIEDGYDKVEKIDITSNTTSFKYTGSKVVDDTDSSGKKILLEHADNQISKESIMIYPPGIPLIVPGEVFTKELIERIKEYKKSNVTILSDYGADYVSVIDTDNWKYYRNYRQRLIDYYEHKISNPRSDGYYMPFEGDKHLGTIVLLPYRIVATIHQYLRNDHNNFQ